MSVKAVSHRLAYAAARKRSLSLRRLQLRHQVGHGHCVALALHHPLRQLRGRGVRRREEGATRPYPAAPPSPQPRAGFPRAPRVATRGRVAWPAAARREAVRAARPARGGTSSRHPPWLWPPPAGSATPRRRWARRCPRSATAAASCGSCAPQPRACAAARAAPRPAASRSAPPAEREICNDAGRRVRDTRANRWRRPSERQRGRHAPRRSCALSSPAQAVPRGRRTSAGRVATKQILGCIRSPAAGGGSLARPRGLAASTWRRYAQLAKMRSCSAIPQRANEPRHLSGWTTGPAARGATFTPSVARYDVARAVHREARVQAGGLRRAPAVWRHRGAAAAAELALRRRGCRVGVCGRRSARRRVEGAACGRGRARSLCCAAGPLLARLQPRRADAAGAAGGAVPRRDGWREAC